MTGAVPEVLLSWGSAGALARLMRDELRNAISHLITKSIIAFIKYLHFIRLC